MKTLDRKAPIPLYFQLKEILNERLHKTPAGEKLPTIRQLRSMFNVNQATVEKALSELEKEGLVRREHGRGIFVEERDSHKIATIGLIVRQEESFIWSDPFYLYAIRIFRGVAAGYNVSLLAEKDSAVPYIKMYHRKDVDGIILMDPKVDDEFLRHFRREGLPFVLIGTYPNTAGLYTVDVDSAAGGRLATEYLIGRGHRRIGIITGPLDYTVSELRLAGYRKALSEYGLPGREALIRQGDYSREDGYRQTMSLLESGNRPTALFVTNGLMSLGALEALREREIAVPGDMAVVGYDDVPFSTMVHPKLTTVQQPIEELISRSFALLEGQIKGEKKDPVHILLEPKLAAGETA